MAFSRDDLEPIEIWLSNTGLSEEEPGQEARGNSDALSSCATDRHHRPRCSNYSLTSRRTQSMTRQRCLRALGNDTPRLILIFSGPCGGPPQARQAVGMTQ